MRESKQQAVIFLSESPEAIGALATIKRVRDEVAERSSFLTKQIQDLHADGAKKMQVEIRSLVVRLRELGRLPEWFDRYQGHLHIDENLGIVVACSKPFETEQQEAMAQAMTLEPQPPEGA